MYFDRNISEKGSYLSCVTNGEFHFSQKEEKYCFTHLRRSPCEVFETRFARQDPHRSKILKPPLWQKIPKFCPKIVKTFLFEMNEICFIDNIKIVVFEEIGTIAWYLRYSFFSLSETYSC